MLSRGSLRLPKSWRMSNPNTLRDISDINLSGADPVNSIKQHLGEVNQENVFRIIRLGLTLVVLGFEAEGKLLKVFQELRGHLSVFERGFASFLRFYTALRTAEAISIGLIKNRYEKEAFKLSYCVKLGCFKDAPPDKTSLYTFS